MKWFLYSACLLGLLAVAPSGLAEEGHHDALSVDPTLTLSHLVALTAQRNPQRLALNGQAALSEARRQQAEAWLPNAPVVTVYHQNDSLGSGRQERDWQAELELPVWLPDQRQTRDAVAQSSAEAYTLGLAALQLRTAGQVRDALWDVAVNQQLVAAAEEGLQLQQALMKDVQRKVAFGELAQTDGMLAKQAVFEAEKAKVNAEAEWMHARFRYKQLTGLDTIPEQFEETRSARASIDQSALWLAAEASVSAAEQQRHLSRIERRENPQVILNARNSQGAFDNAYNQSVGVRVRIPLDSPARGAPIEAEAEMQLTTLHAQRETLRFTLEQAMHESAHAMDTLQAQLEVDAQHLALANQQAQLAHKAFKVGESDVATLLRIQAQAMSVKRQFLSNQIQLKWAIARYNQAVGVLP